MDNKVTEFKCPACGASLKFDATLQSFKCPYCDSEFDLKELANFAENDSEFEEDTSWDTSNSQNEFSAEEQENMSSFICDACGGEVICDANTSSTTCPYCGNNVMIKSRLTGALKPKYIIPFKKTETEAREALKHYLRGKILLPRVFSTENKIKEVKPIYVPYWLYDADVDAKIEFEGRDISHWSDSRYDYTETKYYRVIREGSIAYEHLPVDASKSIENNLTEAIEPYTFSEAKEFNPAYLAGYLSDKYDVTAEEDSVRATQRIKEGTEIHFRQTAKNYDQLDVRSSNIRLYNTNADYALYPLYLLNTKWKDKSYKFAMNGETGKIRGDLPVSWPKFFLLLFGSILLFAFVPAFIAFLLIKDPDDKMGVSIILFAVGLTVGIVVTVLNKRKLKGARLQKGSEHYYKEGSFKLTKSQDFYLYKRVTKRERPQSNDSHGGNPPPHH